MNKRETIETASALLSFICLILSYIFSKNEGHFRVGFYLFVDLALLSIFFRYKEKLSARWKVLWLIFISAIFFVMISIIYFPNWDIKDVATFSLLLFVISFNRMQKKEKLQQGRPEKNSVESGESTIN